MGFFLANAAVGSVLGDSRSTSIGVSGGLMVACDCVITVVGRMVFVVERFAVAGGVVDGGFVVAELSVGVLRGRSGLRLDLGVVLCFLVGERAMVKDLCGER